MAQMKICHVNGASHSDEPAGLITFPFQLYEAF